MKGPTGGGTFPDMHLLVDAKGKVVYGPSATEPRAGEVARRRLAHYMVPGHSFDYAEAKAVTDLRGFERPPPNVDDIIAFLNPAIDAVTRGGLRRYSHHGLSASFRFSDAFHVEASVGCGWHDGPNDLRITFGYHGEPYGVPMSAEQVEAIHAAFERILKDRRGAKLQPWNYTLGEEAAGMSCGFLGVPAHTTVKKKPAGWG